MRSLHLAWSILFALSFVPTTFAQTTRNTSRPATTPRPAATARPVTTARPATTKKAAPARATTTTTTPRRGTLGSVVSPTITSTPTITTPRSIIVTTNRPFTHTPVILNPVDPTNDVLTRQRRNVGGSLAGGGFVAVSPWAFTPSLLTSDVPFRPTPANRPFAGRYPWYHGGWTGWAGWPNTWTRAQPPQPIVSYRNPYYATGPSFVPVAGRPMSISISPQLQAALDYSKPIPSLPAGINSEVVEAAHGRLDAARTAFKKGSYKDALTQIDRGIEILPSDGNFHEFRALTLFANKQYKDAAGVLYAVLAAEPGWNWDTLSSFYTNTDTYTRQLRDLETYVDDNPEDVPARFVLAYHYLVLEERQAALEQLREVVKQNPKDTLSPTLIEALEKAKPRSK